MEVHLSTDGGARGNPGPAGIGAVLTDPQGHVLDAFGDYLGETTNNQAEYRAMLAALERAKELGATDVYACADSELLVKQLNRQYKVRNPAIAKVFLQVWNLAIGFRSISFRHIPRARNHAADRLVNAAIDQRRRVSGKELGMTEATW